jgi:hypothetical protein
LQIRYHLEILFLTACLFIRPIGTPYSFTLHQKGIAMRPQAAAMKALLDQGKTRLGGISKRGNASLRRLLGALKPAS